MKSFILILIATGLLTCGNVFGTGWYVSVSGNDTHPGTAKQPFATLQHAVTMLNAGDTLFVFPGYYRQKLLIDNLKGIVDKPVVIKGLGKVTIAAPENVQLQEGELVIGNFDVPLHDPAHLYYPYFRGAVIRVQHSEHVVLDGLRVINSPWFGLAAYETDHLTVQYCYFEGHGASSFYLLNSRHPVVAFNEITRSNGFNERIDSHGSQECISVVNTDYADIMYNRIHESKSFFYVEYQATGVGGEGIDIKENSRYARVHHNYIFNLMRQGLYIDAWNSL